MYKTCFLFGHSNVSLDLTPAIERAMEDQHAQYGVTQFIMGHYGDFDHMASSAGSAVKQRHLDISLLLLIPYHPVERPLEAPQDFDGTFYPPGMEAVPRRLAIVRANRYMVATADSMICYVKHPGNTRALLESAQRRAVKEGIPLCNLAATLSAPPNQPT